MTANGETSDWDVVIVGAGPAGMAAALYTGRARLKTLLLDRAGIGGGQLMNTELIEDYPAIKTITGGEMARAFEEQIREFGVEVTWGEVIGFEARGNRRSVAVSDSGADETLAPSERAAFRINIKDLRFLKSVGIDPTRKVRRRSAARRVTARRVSARGAHAD